MRKFFLFFIAGILCLTTVTSAQIPRLGVKGGLNLATIAGDLDDTSLKPGFQGGLMLNLMITDQYALQPELLYSIEGSGFADSDWRLNMHYLNIPIMGKFFIGDGFNFQFGPQIGFLLNAKYTDGSESVDLESQTTKTVALAVGLGAGYQKDHFVLDIRYNLGLTNVFENDYVFDLPILFSGNNSDDFTFTSQVIQLSVGYLF
ncbi:MAG: porin family protein [Candidatus Cyclobacteriaceae bacterium M3_2C_046]